MHSARPAANLLLPQTAGLNYGSLLSFTPGHCAVGLLMSICTKQLSVLALVALAGCSGRGETDLLQARLRSQQEQLLQAQTQLNETNKSLAQTRREAEQLRTELAQATTEGAKLASTGPVVPVSAIKINSMLTAGVDKDDTAGDDAVVVNFAPYDDDGEMVKLHGPVDIVAIDPTQPEGQSVFAKWSFTTDETRDHWVRGFLGSGYQFTLPWPEPPQHEELVLHVRLRADDGREFVATQVVKIRPEVDTAGGTSPATTETRRPVADDLIESIDEKPSARSEVRESTNWTYSTIPIRR